ncbi:GntR family transcriptional regulator [Devosia sp. FJ2-5-3]|uniref:GntR family transcriptional regulator n=1 Tax=Devosia sp. FJ2-5-3 TaxID=2976680 RepID=UPI0023D89D16|nr:GntR family transcriptional regulator [Devosia sp. FJ2-5-3]WEJ59748.1 GntR family transcriptional regulator [Devosia sp. FJ2-5-3]
MTDHPAGLVRPDRRRPEPLWHQAEMALRYLIDRGEWAPGMQIPNEDKLCEMLGISRITLRHALRNLEEAGMLRREHGRGTFVRSATMVAGVRGLTSFTDEMQTLALSPGTRLLAAQIIGASGATAEALEIAEGEDVVQLRRLRLGNGQPIGIQTTHLPASRVPGLFEAASEVNSLYRWLKDNAGIVPVRAKEVYRVGAVAKEDAGDLELPAGTPAFEVERITFDARSPFEFAVSTMRADRYEIRSTLYV